MIRQIAVMLILSTLSLNTLATTEKEAFEAWQGFISSGNQAMTNKNYEVNRPAFSGDPFV